IPVDSSATVWMPQRFNQAANSWRSGVKAWKVRTEVGLGGRGEAEVGKPVLAGIGLDPVSSAYFLPAIWRMVQLSSLHTLNSVSRRQSRIDHTERTPKDAETSDTIIRTSQALLRLDGSQARRAMLLRTASAGRSRFSSRASRSGERDRVWLRDWAFS